MTRIAKIESKRIGSGRSMGRLALTALFMLGTFVASAGAQEHREDGRRGYQRDYNREVHRDYHREVHRDWNGGYYPAPPVVYGTPYYAPPPVVYGPNVGIVVPGIVIGVHWTVTEAGFPLTV